MTGASGYIGAGLVRHLRANGTDVLSLSRKVDHETDFERHYELGSPLDPDLLANVDVVVHCAYDLSDRSPSGINVSGSERLFENAARRHARVILVSSLSAYRGCKSQYGQSKLELERRVAAIGGISIRPGLVFGKPASGLFASVVAGLERRIVPVVGGNERLYVSHDEALFRSIALWADGQRRPNRQTVFAAAERPTSLRAIRRELAHGETKSTNLMPIPWRAAWAGLQFGERLSLPLPFTSDSVLALANPIPLDQVAELESSGVEFPEFSRDLIR